MDINGINLTAIQGHNFFQLKLNHWFSPKKRNLNDISTLIDRPVNGGKSLLVPY